MCGGVGGLGLDLVIGSYVGLRKRVGGVCIALVISDSTALVERTALLPKLNGKNMAINGSPGGASQKKKIQNEICKRRITLGVMLRVGMWSSKKEEV